MLCVRRREFIAALGGAAAWPFGASAQQRERIRLIGWRSAELKIIWNYEPSGLPCRRRWQSSVG